MIDYAALRDCLSSIGIADWSERLVPLIQSRFSATEHGDFERWAAALESLAESSDDASKLKQTLLGLAPWRKGPFDVGGVHIDAEWQSDKKWSRVSSSLQPLDGRNILDVGCGNGYYALRMHAAGANCVIGIDPTLLYVMQFLAIDHFARTKSVFVLPLRLQELPSSSGKFDTTFSMGVLYHQRSPIEHLRHLRGTLRSRGQLVLETLFVPGEESYACTPSDRYARMKNVWLLPTIAELTTWLERTGFKDVAVVDRSITTAEEQRSTEWMPFESLAEALDPDDPSRTVEGWPSPRRVVMTATSP